MPSWSLLPWVKPNAPSEYSYIVKDGNGHCIFYSKEKFEKLPLTSSLQIQDQQTRLVVTVSLRVEEAKKLMKKDLTAIEEYIIVSREDVFDGKARQWQPGEPHQFLEPYCCVIS